jgi:hypothetical protein
LVFALTRTKGSTSAKAGPEVHVARHSPLVQTCPPVHVVPHEPQFDESRFTSTQAALQLVMHDEPQLPAEQSGRSKVPVAVHWVHVAPHALT